MSLSLGCITLYRADFHSYTLNERQNFTHFYHWQLNNVKILERHASQITIGIKIKTLISDNFLNLIQCN